MADRRLQVFHAVAQCRSFTKAAEKLFMSQPAVTFQIKQLEDQFRMRLFLRAAGTLTLTPAGELVMDYAGRILDLGDEMETRLAEMTGERRGPLRIGASPGLAQHLLPGVLGELNAHHPRLLPRLAVGGAAWVRQELLAGKLDIGLVEGDMDEDAVEGEVCGEDELLAVCAPESSLARHRQVTPKVLLDYEFIAREEGSGTRRAAENFFRRAGFEPQNLKIQMELGSPAALLAVVAAGHGVAVAPRRSCRPLVEAGRLLALPLKPRLACPIRLVYPVARFRPLVVETFGDFVKRHLREKDN